MQSVDESRNRSEPIDFDWSSEVRVSVIAHKLDTL